MTIHVVQFGETLNSISEYYHIPAERLILENGITNPDNLVEGQTLVINLPKLVYTIQPGDTLEDIAARYGTSVMELLRNNPYLSDREFIYPGETIVVSYQTDKIRTIATSGYAFPYIDRSILRKTLPFLTYLTIFNHRVTSDGEFIDVDDSEVIQIAKDYGVAPMMFVSSLTEQGTSSSEVAFNILSNPEVQERLINNTLQLLRAKGYYGVNIYIEYINLENINQIADYLSRITTLLYAEGFRVIITVTPRVYIENTEVTFERFDYSKLAVYADGILFISYEWGISYGPPSSITPVNLLRELLNYAVSIVPHEKIFIGMIPIGYDWTLPYVPGVTNANAITSDSAIQIAAEYGVPILFNEIAQAPYIYYTLNGQELHLIWFKDARSFDAIAGLVPEYGHQGLSIWNIMYFNAQMWYVINLKYDIEKIENIKGI